MNATSTLRPLVRGIVLAALAASAQGCATGSRGGASSGGDQWTQTVLRQLSTVDGIARNEGMTRLGNPLVGSLTPRATTMLQMNLQAGRRYRLFGVCDNDCSDLDLRLVDPSGAAVAEDVAADDVPIVAYTAQRSGSYRVQVIMTTCSVSPCRYGVSLYGR
ncbi:hypothetical protein SAMN05216486_10823 [bacterium JGI 053]|nr:hypothetical protein SAMN05216486_10823 [bacterium JGI 053]